MPRVNRPLVVASCLLPSCAGSPSETSTPVAPRPASAATEVRDEEPSTDAIAMPTAFEGERIFLELRTRKGQPLRLFTDTGGGLYLHRHAVERLGLTMREAPSDGGRLVMMADLPPLDPATPMPPVLANAGRIPIAGEDPFGGAFGDGILGQAWFRERVWTFDYADEVLLLHPMPPTCGGQEIPLGFAEDDDGRRRTHYPRIQADIDGGTHDLLFDTGATVLLTDRGLQGLGDGGPTERATSFIVRSVFDGWRRAHPDWRVIEGADRLADDPMIQIPTVRIGDLEVGPVWFTARDDPNFHQFMSKWMDRRVDGALGGSALHYFRITVDYPGASACFDVLGR